MNFWFSVSIVCLSFTISFRSWAQTAAPEAPVFRPAEPAVSAPATNLPGPDSLQAPSPAVAATPPGTTKAVVQVVEASGPVIDQDPNAKSRFAFELHTNGFFSSLRDGLFFGGGSRRFTAGLTIDLDQTNFGGDRKATSFAFGPSFRWALASGLDDRVDLTLGANLTFMKNMVTDNQGLVESDGYGFLGGVGPGLRYWMTKSLALTYSALLTAELRLNRSQDVVYISTLERMIGGLPVTRREKDAFYLYVTGQLALTGYF
ncbi:MAG: hypothetical protein QOI66_4884 [Myxococcales bacterium]|jgi:hypothetical protein|nr:hypothetical protein [Myxococcales bacterium]